MKFSYASGTRPLEGYTIKRGVGSGGFGEVYFATSDAGKEVALKRIERNLDIELRGVRQCLNLKHANLIALFDIRYDDRGEAWVVMEYVAGENLRDVIERNPRGMPLQEADAWFQGIAAGVEYLHDHGIVHRDLKPGNIFLDDDVVKIGDYGLSKFISCSRRSGQTESVGTFHYMAPEIGKGVYGKEIDIYALGIILYEMLTGEVPFEGESSQEIIMKHLTADPDMSGIAQPYRGIIERCLYKDPDKRFHSVGELRQRLHPGAGAEADLVVAEIAAEEVPGPILSPAEQDDGTLYISDDTPDEMLFGPIKQRRPVTPVAAQRPRVGGRATVDSEPIAQAVRQGVGQAHGWWSRSRLNAPAKVLLLVAVLFLAVLNANWLVPLAMAAGAVYLIYFGIRALVLAANSSGRQHNPPARAVAGQRSLPRRGSARNTALAREMLANKVFSDRVTELSGACLMSAGVSAVLCLVLMIVGGQGLNASVDTWNFYVWFTLTSSIGAWLVLGLNNVWEGAPREEQVQRRFAMLVAGLILGAVAWAGSQLLLVRLPDVPGMSLPALEWVQVSSGMYAADGAPMLPSYLVYFGGLFLILRWWKQADPLRKTRLSVWATGVCVLCAWVLNIFWQFPQPWGFMLAATISIAVQFSAPWINDQERVHLNQRYRQA